MTWQNVEHLNLYWRRHAAWAQTLHVVTIDTTETAYGYEGAFVVGYYLTNPSGEKNLFYDTAHVEDLFIQADVMDVPLAMSLTLQKEFGWVRDGPRLRRLHDLERLALEAPRKEAQ